MMSKYEDVCHSLYCSYRKGLILSLMFMLVLVTVSVQQAEAAKRVLTMDDYGRWQTITSAQLSSDGHWITYDYLKPEADEDAPDERKLQIKHLNSDRVYQVPLAISPVFSEDAKWVAYLVDLDRHEAKKHRDQKKPVPRKVQLHNLETGDKFTWENTTSFRFAKSSRVLAIQKPKLPGVSHSGSDLIIRDLNTHLDHHFGSVSQYSFNKPGTHLAQLSQLGDENTILKNIFLHSVSVFPKILSNLAW